ncbi:GyrI-like domain-containing protein [Herbiconiux sp. VKM Ac-2851]|uniref:GyrI-like domain-containing protein n=1 Tax=Herbiconiux sp. VKM Ac-2851 TaxID=2739025 RepID=UPI001564C650|nr:GyrI-like domain-containing protein [Herbiconiux sp. VKM Ac-2851]NQX34774.1 GyrI-like domain-containing protein [Herbiconiux sp. VKM Ac-2851]
MKVDLKSELGDYTAARGRFDVVTVPPRGYLMLDGRGDPNTASAFGEAVQALYPVAYGVKAAARRQLDRDHVVMPLEGLWWSDDWADFTSARDKSRWSWTLMILQPDWITSELVDTAMATARAKRAEGEHDALDRLRFEQLDEGLCVQTLHLGPFDDEGPVLARMHDEVIPGEGLRMRGRHHEVYLSDRRRTAPERLRTILRQPVEAVPPGS